MRVNRKLNQVSRAQGAPGFSFIQESLLGKNVIKAFGKEQIFLAKLMEIYDRELLVELATSSCQNWKNGRMIWILKIAKAFGMALVLL